MIQAVFETRLKDMAMAVPLMCCAADLISVPSRKQVVLVGHRESSEFDNMLAAAHALYDPNRTVSNTDFNVNPIKPESQLRISFALLTLQRLISFCDAMYCR